MVKARSSLTLVWVLLLGIVLSLAAVETVQATAMTTTGPIQVDLLFTEDRAGTQVLGMTTGHGIGIFGPSRPMTTPGLFESDVLFDYTAPFGSQTLMVRGNGSVMYPGTPGPGMPATMMLLADVFLGGQMVIDDAMIMPLVGTVPVVGNQPQAQVIGASFSLGLPVGPFTIPGFPTFFLPAGDHRIIGTPEPSTLVLFGTSLVAGLAAVAVRRRRSR